MQDSRKTGAAQALSDGISRVASAPVVLGGTIAVVLCYGPAATPRHGLGAVLLWAFLSGGVLDRYARRRPTRGRGFFAACGAHVGAMLRLAALAGAAIVAFHLITRERFENPYVHETGFAIALVLGLVLSFGQARIAVEDRRSAIGALRAGGRFVARNPASIALYALFVTIALALVLVFERAVRTLDPLSWQRWLTYAATAAAETALLLVWLATAVSLFQGRMAHAGYTAAPPLLWPDSPAAEAIGNAAPGGWP